MLNKSGFVVCLEKYPLGLAFWIECILEYRLIIFFKEFDTHVQLSIKRVQSENKTKKGVRRLFNSFIISIK